MPKKPTATRQKGLSGYAPFLGATKNRIRAAQVKATLAASAELIHLYWDIGRAIDAMQKKEGWGAGVIPRLARDIANDMPEVKGFSERNIGRMIAFAREYPAMKEFLPQAAAKIIDSPIVPQPVAQIPGLVILPQVVAKLAFGDDSTKVQGLVARLPWGHNVLLLEQVKDLRVRPWYMQQTIAHG